MGKICWLEGEPYFLTLPCYSAKGTDDDWSLLAKAVGKDNAMMYWEQMFSWVENPEIYLPNASACGGIQADYLLRVNESMKRPDIGFRPCLVPLDPETNHRDKGVFENQPDGEVLQIGALYMGNKPVMVPHSPCGNGDVESYRKGKILEIKDSPDESCTISWIVCGSNLVADRCLLNNISYKELIKASIARG